MRSFIIILASALFFGFTLPASANDEIVRKKSAHDVNATIDQLEGILKEKGITVFTRVDHANGANKVGLELRPTVLLIFGNPKLGTPLMQANRLTGLDLPMKALAYEEADGSVWLAYVKPGALQSRHDLEEKTEIFKKMAGALDKLTDAAVK